MQTESINIFEAIRSGNFHSSFCLSYSCDLLFYDQAILRQLRAVGCRNNAVIIDAFKYHEIFNSFSSLVRYAGSLYTVTPIAVRGSFHPKIMLLIGNNELLLLIGSGNLSLGGISKNKEVFTAIDAYNAQEPNAAIIVDAWNYLKGLNIHAMHFTARQIDMAEKESILLQQCVENRSHLENIIAITDQSRAALMTSANKASIIAQLKSAIATEKVQSITVVAPFFDAGVKTIKALLDAFNPPRFNIIVQRDTVNLDIKALMLLKDKRIRIHGYDGAENEGNGYSSYLHAKGIFLQSNRGEHALLGSANITFSGLGNLSAAGNNAEACLYFHHTKQNVVMDRLGLSKMLSEQHKLSDADVKAIRWVAGRNDHAGTTSTVSAALSFCIKQGKIEVTIDEDINKKHSWILELKDRHGDMLGEFRLVQAGMRMLTSRCPQSVLDKAILARVVFAQKRRSSWHLISRISNLGQTIPNPRIQKLVEIIDRINIGSTELSDLIEPIEKLIFHNQDVIRLIRQHGGPPNDKEQQETATEEKRVDYEKFVSQATIAKEKPHYLASEETELGVLIKFIMSRIGFREEEQYEGEEIDLGLYEEEEMMAEKEGREERPAIQLAQKRSTNDLTVSQLERNRRQIERLAQKYSSYLTEILHSEQTEQLDQTELIKYFAVMYFLICFAGREKKGRAKGVLKREAILAVYDDEAYAYFDYALDITAKMFCTAPSPVIKRIYCEESAKGLPPDMLSAITLGAFAITTVCLLGQKYKYADQHAVQVAQMRYYLNSGISVKIIKPDQLREIFRKYYEHSGLQNDITFDEILVSHDQCMKDSSRIRTKIDKAREVFERKEKGKLPLVHPNDLVWNIKSGFSVVKRIEGSSRVIVSNPGYVDEIDDERNNEQQLGQGYLVALH